MEQPTRLDRSVIGIDLGAHPLLAETSGTTLLRDELNLNKVA